MSERDTWSAQIEAWDRARNAAPWWWPLPSRLWRLLTDRWLCGLPRS